MDRQEYKILSEQITKLSANQQFAEAAEIADQIDWRKVRSFSTLMSISEIYQFNHRYEDALELMLMAYDRNPKNRSIVYSLCELYILLNDNIKSLEFFGLYKRLAPKDMSGHYILQYKIQEMQGASLDDQIALLEMFTRKEYREEWVYQLAYLYHRVGLSTKCVETCNGLVATFGDGPFVIKALELKMLHARLRPEEQRIYDARGEIADKIEAYESDEYTAEQPEPGLHPEMGDPADWHVKTIDMSKFNTIAMQNELAKSMRELMADNNSSKGGRGKGKAGQPMAEDDYMSTAEMEERNWEATEPLEDEPEDGYYGDEEEYADDHTMFIPQGGYTQAEGYEDGEYTEEGEYYGEDGEYYGEEGEYTEDGEYYGEDGEYTEDGEYYGEDGEYSEEGEYTEDGEYTEEGEYTEDGEYTEEDGYAEDGTPAEEDAESVVEAEVSAEEKDAESEADEPIADEAQEETAAAEADTEKSVSEETASEDAEKEAEKKAEVKQDSIVLGTGDLSEIRISGISAEPKDMAAPEKEEPAKAKDGEVFFEDRTSDIVIDSLPSGTNPEYKSLPQVAENVRLEEQIEKEEKAKEASAEAEVRRKRKASEPAIEDMLYTAPDGQMGMSVPQSKIVEKQITGQIEINEYLADWEDKKRRQSEAQKQALEKRINDSTGPIFAGYDARMRNNMIEELEREQKLFADKYRADDIEFRSVDEVAKDNAATQESAAAVTPATEMPKETGEGQEAHKSIWDEVHEALEAEQQATQPIDAKAVAEGAAATLASGATGLVDAAVAPADQLVSKATAITESEEKTKPAGGYEDDFFEGEVDEDDEDAAGTHEEEKTEELTSGDAESEEEPLTDGEEEIPEADAEVYEDGEYVEDGEYYEDGEYAEDGEYYEDGEYAEDGEYYEDGEYAEDGEYYEDGEYAEDGEYYEDGEYAGDGEYAEGEETGAGEYSSGNDVDDEYVREILKEKSESDTQEYSADPNTEQLKEIASVLEADADRVGAETVEEINDEYVADADEQGLSVEEQELFHEYLYSKKMYTQILEAVDQISLAPYVGNAIVTGDADAGVERFGKCLIKEIQMIDGNFLSNRIARISGNKMNRKNIPAMFAQLGNGALLVEKASDMTRETLEILAKTLDDLQEGLFVILMDDRKNMDKLLEKYELITGYFNARVDILPMNNNALVEYAKKYAYSREYKIDEERGVLALHQKISERQIGEHNVSPREIEEIINAAIEHSSKPHISTFFQILSGKRYDYEDMIILREKDFL